MPPVRAHSSEDPMSTTPDPSPLLADEAPDAPPLLPEPDTGTGTGPRTSTADPGAAPMIEVDEDEAWLRDGPPKGVRVRVPVALLVLVLVAVAGIWGGARLQRSQQATTTAGGFGAPTGAFPGFGAATGAAGTNGTNGTRGQGAAGSAGGTGGGFAGRGGTVGTVESVDGGTIVITSANGEKVTVKTAAATTVTKNETGAVSDIKTGDTIVVRGTAGADGSTEAQTITIGGAGATGFPGGGTFPGGGAPTGGQAPTGFPPGG